MVDARFLGDMPRNGDGVGYEGAAPGAHADGVDRAARLGAGSVDTTLLVGQLMTQAAGVLTRVIDRVVTDLSARGELGLDAAQPPDELIADAIADRISAFLGPADAGARTRTELELAGPTLDEHEALLERNGDLARALGSCDCWGDVPSCGVCRGAGRPGWALPDREMFDAFVRPAVETMRVEQAAQARTD